MTLRPSRGARKVGVSAAGCVAKPAHIAQERAQICVGKCSARRRPRVDLHAVKDNNAITSSQPIVLIGNMHSPVRHVQQVQASTACNQKGTTMSDITLTAGIRQNLLSLQQTSADLTTTQEALATGKTVNSAADNPSAYFTSQNLTNDRQFVERLARPDRPRLSRPSTPPPTASPA